MGSRGFVIGLAVCGVLTSSCASTARDTLVDIYNDEAEAGSYDDACRVEDQTLATASDAYQAANGTSPSSMADLVPDYLREEPENWAMAADATFIPVLGGRCENVELTDRSTPSIGQIAVDGIADGNDAACASDQRQVETALDTHFALNGYDATTMDELLQFGVEDEVNRWTLQSPTDAPNSVPMVVPIVGGPCDG